MGKHIPHLRISKSIMWAAGLFLAFLLFFPVKAGAAETAATSSNGYYMYFSVDNTIYRMHTKTGSVKKIRQISEVAYVDDISYYKGYLYFTGNTYSGSDGMELYICRVKKNGKSFQKLGDGYGCRIYGGKIYYTRGMNVDEYGSPQTKTIGIARMKLNGKSKTSLLSVHEEDAGILGMEIAGGKIYYVERGKASKPLYSCSLKGKNEADITYANSVKTDGKQIYYTTETSVYRYKNGTSEWICPVAQQSGESRTALLGARNGWVYLADHIYGGTPSFYRVKASTGAKKTLASYDAREMSIGKGKCLVVHRVIPFDGRYDYVCSRITTAGKMKKTIRKYYRS